MGRNNSGITLIELLVVIGIISIVAVIIGPQIGLFRSDYNLRSCATELIQDMRVARAMAIKENREYLIVFDTTNGRYLMGYDDDGDNNLTTLDRDTFGICKDIDGDRLPEGDALVNGVPSCVRVVNITECGNNIIYGYGTGTKPPQGPNGTPVPVSGVSFSGGATWADFNADGSAGTLGSVYFQQTTRGYSYCVRVSDNVGTTNMWRWEGSADDPTEIDWQEIR